MRKHDEKKLQAVVAQILQGTISCTEGSRQSGVPNSTLYAYVRKGRARLRNRLNPVEAPTELRCYSCQTVKPVEQMCRDAGSLHGYRAECRVCWTARHRAWRIKRQFGITITQYDAMLATQGGTCALCGQPPEGGQLLSVDHDHVDGHIRGLLCTSCNLGLGMLGDTVVGLQRALSYLQRPAVGCVTLKA